METMIDILRERLPDGLEITKVKDTASASQIKIWFTYKGMEAVNWISKTCAPGCATTQQDFAIKRLQAQCSRSPSTLKI